MQQVLSAFFVLGLLFCSGCRVWSTEHYVADESYELARIERADGSRDLYELKMALGGGDASLRVTSEYTRKRAFLGLKVVELDRAGAENRGVQPYAGLLVTGTYPESAAEAAGILAGDVLLTVGDKSTVYARHIADVEGALRPGQQVKARVLRGQTEATFDVTARELAEQVTDPQDIELEKPPQSRPYAGVVLRGIPSVWAERMFGNNLPAIVIASVAVGSPAWAAGFRGGDLIEAVDGLEVPPLRELARTIRERGEAGQVINLRVRRDGRQHTGDVALSDYTDESMVWFPLVFSVHDGAQTDDWSVGPLTSVCRNRSRWIADNTTREPRTENTFWALLGLIKVHSAPRDSHVRLLWFIHIDT